MNIATKTPTIPRTISVPRAHALRILWSGWAAAVPIVLLATVAVHATPHARGIGFHPALRFVVVAPACIVVAVMAAFLYRPLARRSGRPRHTLAVVLFGATAVVLAGMMIAGPSGLAGAAWSVLLVAAVAIVWLVPDFVEQPRRSRVGTIAIVVFGALEVIGVFAARSSEPVAPPAPGGLAFDIPPGMFDADHKFVDLPGGARVHYVDEGRGETLLFLHGNPGWSFQWRDLIRGLRGSHRCVALDYPGFGLSDPPPGFGFTPREQSRVVEEFVDRLGLRDVTLVMQDWGGPVGLGLAERRPELVRRVVLANSWAWPTSLSETRGKFSAIAGGPIGEFVQVNFNGFIPFAMKNGVADAMRPDVLEMYMRPFRPLDRRGVAAFYPGQITAAHDYFAELEAGLPRVQDRPALLFWALKDPGFPPADLARFAAAFPNHRTVELPDAHHFLFEDAADQMVSEIGAFLANDSDRLGHRGDRP